MDRKIAYGCLFVLASGCGVTASEDSDTSDQSSSEVVGNVVPDGDYVLHSTATNHCLDVSGGSQEDGAKVQEWTCNGTKAQLFHVESVVDGFVKITNVNSGKALDIQGVSTAESAPVQQWGYGGGANQQFKLVNRGGANFSIEVRHTGMALDLSWGKADDGTPIVQYPYWGGSNQQWQFDKQGGGTTGGDTGGDKSPLPTRLRITSNCADPIWIAHSENVPDAQNVLLHRGEHKDFNIPDGGLQATRFWPKIGCDGSGNNCSIGQSSAPCPAGGCQPPIDSKFEASFFAKGSDQNTWYNASQVDGYTLPFKIVPRGGSVGQGDCVASDAGGLSLDRCPGDENIGGAGADLRVRDGSGRVVGCMSPCKKWNYPAPYGFGKPENQDPGLHLCCPTPIDPASGQCTVANGCMTSQACSNAGDPQSVVHTQYVQAMHQMASTTYSYAYDDANGLHQCSSNTTFEVTFCP